MRMSLRFLSGESDADDLIYPYDYDQFKAAVSQRPLSFA